MLKMYKVVTFKRGGALSGVYFFNTLEEAKQFRADYLHCYNVHQSLAPVIRSLIIENNQLAYRYVLG